MAKVVVQDIAVLGNEGASFTDPFKFEITFECTDALQHDIEWKIIYVGSAETEDKDQELESIMVGPVPVGTCKFVFEAEPPKWDVLPENEIRGVTVVLITCSYNQAEFIRIGYYLNNDYRDPALREEPPDQITAAEMVPLLQREILADKPRVTRYTIGWDEEQTADQRDFARDNAALPATEDGVMEGEDEEMEDGESEQDSEGSEGMEQEAGGGMHQDALQHGHGMQASMGGMVTA